MKKPDYYVASFSGGKDSTAMVLRLIELGEPLDEIMHCDTTAEFPAMYRHIEKVRKVAEAAGVKFTDLRAEHDFEHYLLHHVPKRRKAELDGLVGFSWPGPLSRWCTRALKIDPMNKHVNGLRERYNVIRYIGIAADEPHRLERKNNQDEDMRHPLVEWGWDEAQAMAYCRAKGYDWEGLYDIFSRVSCWLCPLQSLTELRKLRQCFPDLWQKLKELDAQTFRNFYPHGYTVEDLDSRFALEEALTEAGESIKNKAFFADLKRMLAGEVTVEEILAERHKEAGA